MTLINGRAFLYGITKNITTEIDDNFELVTRTPIKLVALYFTLLLLFLIGLFATVFLLVFAVDLGLSIV